MMISQILDYVGNTPLVRLNIDDLPNVNVFGKLEYYNPTGSLKDRAASYILSKCLKDGVINLDTTIIESSSGNFGVALSAFSARLGLKFICVIDQTISPINEMLIRSHGAKVFKVDVIDENGGYLLNRIRKVKELKSQISNSYWVNQYENPLNAEAYYNSLGEEICDTFDGKLDVIFLGVSSGGTITGLSRKIKERSPSTVIVAVDVYGSVIFGKSAAKRNIPGIGSSMVPKILKQAYYDEVMWVDETSLVRHCHELLSQHAVFVGGSSGATFCAMKEYFRNRSFDRTMNALCLFPDRGDRYSNTIYNDQWCERYLLQEEVV